MTGGMRVSEKNGAKTQGIEHCGQMQEWKDLCYRIVDGTWIWSCSICKEDLRRDPFSGVTPSVDSEDSVLFGRGIWHVNEQRVVIEIPGWYDYRDGNWVYSSEQTR